MRRYFQLRDDLTVAGRWHIGDVRTKNGREPVFDAGQRYDGAESLFGEVTRAGRVLDFSLTSFAVPVASRAVAEAVSAIAGADVQCVPVTIGGQSGMQVLNATRLHPCLDESRSEFPSGRYEDACDSAGRRGGSNATVGR